MRVRAIKKCFIDNGLRAPGTPTAEFDYHGPKNVNLVPVDGSWPAEIQAEVEDGPKATPKSKAKPGPKTKPKIAPMLASPENLAKKPKKATVSPMMANSENLAKAESGEFLG